jgi:hypothetical protein
LTIAPRFSVSFPLHCSFLAIGPRRVGVTADGVEVVFEIYIGFARIALGNPFSLAEPIGSLKVDEIRCVLVIGVKNAWLPRFLPSAGQGFLADDVAEMRSSHSRPWERNVTVVTTTQFSDILFLQEMQKPNDEEFECRPRCHYRPP